MFKPRTIRMCATLLAISLNSCFAYAERPIEVTLPADGVKVVVGFSPEGSAQKAILDLINSAHDEIKVGAFSFTSQAIVKALINAHRKGVVVQIVVDKKQNTDRYAISAMNTIVNAGIALRTNEQFALHHDKYILVDKISMESGSYNYSYIV